jgi:large subunit ribosomal protein L25
MAQTTLVATTGRPTGSAASRRLRREDKIPGVLYGLGMAPVAVTVDRRDLRLALSGPAGSNTILSLEVDGTSYPAVVKELQRHPIRRTVSHVDFLAIDMKEELTVSVPVHLVGEAAAVEAAGGLVDAAVDTIEVSTTPANMPNEITVDISDMQPHEVIRLRDLLLPAGVTALGDPDLPIVTVIYPAAAAAAEAAEEAAGEAEAAAEAAEAAEGDATE